MCKSLVCFTPKFNKKGSARFCVDGSEKLKLRRRFIVPRRSFNVRRRRFAFSYVPRRRINSASDIYTIMQCLNSPDLPEQVELGACEDLFMIYHEKSSFNGMSGMLNLLC
jgi:hypothetical protein